MTILNLGQQGCEGCEQLEAVLTALDAAIRKLRDAGRPMSNYFFNTSQSNKLYSETQRASMKEMQLTWDKASERARAQLVEVERCLATTTCANCGRAWAFRGATIAGDGGEWFCSLFCADCHDALGCPRERVDHIDEMHRRHRWRRVSKGAPFAITPEMEGSREKAPCNAD